MFSPSKRLTLRLHLVLSSMHSSHSLQWTMWQARSKSSRLSYSNKQRWTRMDTLSWFESTKRNIRIITCIKQLPYIERWNYIYIYIWKYSLIKVRPEQYTTTEPWNTRRQEKPHQWSNRGLEIAISEKWTVVTYWSPQDHCKESQ